MQQSIRYVSYIILSLFLFSASASAFEGYVFYTEDGGMIQWGDGEISVVKEVEAGEGEEPWSPLAIRKAASQARRQMLDMLMSVRIDGRQTVSSYLADNAELAAQVRGLVHNSLFQGPETFSEVGTVTVSESLRGKLAELILPTTIPFQSGIPPKLSTSMEQSMTFTGAMPEEVGVSDSGYTGVIIDARGLQVTPALTPVVYGQDGLGAYGAFVVGRTNTIEQGVVAYAKKNDPPVLSVRVGSRPLVVRALKTYGSWRTDLVVSTANAHLIRSIMRKDDVAAKCGMVIILDRFERKTDETGDKAKEDSDA